MAVRIFFNKRKYSKRKCSKVKEKVGFQMTEASKSHSLHIGFYFDTEAIGELVRAVIGPGLSHICYYMKTRLQEAKYGSRKMSCEVLVII